MKRFLLVLFLAPLFAHAQVITFNGRSGGVLPQDSDYAAFYQSKVFINVKDFGAVGDSTTDNTVALRNAFIAGAGGNIYFPPGNYVISDTVAVPKSCTIIGSGGLAPYTGTPGINPVGTYQGGNSVIIQTSGTANALVINASGVEIMSMTIKCSAATPTSGAGVLINKGNAFRMQNTFIGYFYSNLVANSLTEAYIAGNQFVNPQLYNMSISGTIDDEGDNDVEGNWFNSSLSPTAIDLHADHAGGLRIKNNKFHKGVGQAGPFALGIIDVLAKSSTSDLLIQGNSIEAFTGFAIRFNTDSASRTFSKVFVQDNQFSKGPGSGNLHEIDLEALTPGNLQMVNISGNVIFNTGTMSSINLVNADVYNVSGNVFHTTANNVTYTGCTNNRFNFSGDLRQDNSNFFYDATNLILHLGKNLQVQQNPTGIVPSFSGFDNSGRLKSQFIVSPTTGNTYIDFSGTLDGGSGGVLFRSQPNNPSSGVARFDKNGWFSLGLAPPASVLYLNQGTTQANWGTSSGIDFRMAPETFTDNSTAGGATLAAMYANSVSSPTFAFANGAVTVTKAVSFVIHQPSAGTGAIFTNKYPLEIAESTILMDGLVASKPVFTDANKALTTTGPGTATQFLKGNGTLDATAYAPAANPVFTGQVTTPVVNSTATQTTVAGTTGNAVCSEPFQGSSYKKVMIYCNNLTGTATYTFPVAFLHPPVVVNSNGLPATTVTATSATSVTLNGSTSTGFLVLEGF